MILTNNTVQYSKKSTAKAQRQILRSTWNQKTTRSISLENLSTGKHYQDIRTQDILHGTFKFVQYLNEGIYSESAQICFFLGAKTATVKTSSFVIQKIVEGRALVSAMRNGHTVHCQQKVGDLLTTQDTTKHLILAGCCK